MWTGVRESTFSERCRESWLDVVGGTIQYNTIFFYYSCRQTAAKVTYKSAVVLNADQVATRMNSVL